jgi:hypothetical protein
VRDHQSLVASGLILGVAEMISCLPACYEARTDGLARTIAFGVMSMSVAKEVSRGSRRPAAVLRPTGEDLARIYLDVLAVLMIQAATEDR